MFVRV